MKRILLLVTLLLSFSTKAADRLPADILDISSDTPLHSMKGAMAKAMPGAAVVMENLTGGLILVKAERIDGPVSQQLRAIYRRESAESGPHRLTLLRTSSGATDKVPVLEVTNGLTEKYGKPRGELRREMEAPAQYKMPRGGKAYMHRMLWSKSGRLADANEAGCDQDQSCGDQYIYSEVWGAAPQTQMRNELTYWFEVTLVDNSGAKAKAGAVPRPILK